MNNIVKETEGKIFFTIRFKSENGINIDIGVVPFEEDDFYLMFSCEQVDKEILQKIYEISNDEEILDCDTLLIDKLIIRNGIVKFRGYAVNGIEEIVDEKGILHYYISNQCEGMPGYEFKFAMDKLAITEIEKERFAFLMEEGYIDCDAQGLIALGYTPKMYLVGAKNGSSRFVL